MNRIPRAISTVLLGGSLAFGGGCDKAGTGASSGSSGSSAGGSAPVAAAGTGPVLEFTSTTFSFGTIWDVEERRCTFPFRNAGSEPLIIGELKPSCGCTAVSLDRKVFPPGEGSEIEVVFKPSGTGPVRKFITVNSNEDTPTRLTIDARVKPAVTFEPRPLNLGVIPLGERSTALLKVASADPGMTIESVDTLGQHLDARLLGEDATQAGRFEIEVAVSEDAPWGEISGNVKVACTGRFIEGGEEIEHEAKLHVKALVFGDLHVEATTIRVGAVEPGAAFSKSMRLTRPSGLPFAILSTTIDRTSMDGVEFRAEPISEAGVSGYELIVSGESGDHKGLIHGGLTIQTDVPGEEVIKLKFAGGVRQATK